VFVKKTRNDYGIDENFQDLAEQHLFLKIYFYPPKRL